LKTYFDLGTFYWLSKLSMKGPTQSPTSTEKASQNLPVLNVYKMPSPLKTLNPFELQYLCKETKQSRMAEHLRENPAFEKERLV